MGTERLGWPARVAAALLAGAVLLAGPAFGHGPGSGAGHGTAKKPAEATPFGRPGDPARVARVVRVDMLDTMRFSPAEITVRRGDTVRFAVRNAGRTLHEMVLGRMQDLQEHAELMKRFPGMEHDEPNMVHVRAGARGDIVWQFDQAGEFHFACLIPGHFDSGMVGRIRVLP